MSRSSKVSRTFEFLRVFGAAKVEANCTGFSAELFGSQSVEMFCFARKTKNSNVDNFFPGLDKNPPISS